MVEMIDKKRLEQAMSINRIADGTWNHPLMDPPTFILGMYRGGTSLVTAAFALSGAWTGYLQPANKFNRKGYYENNHFNSVMHALLQLSGYNDSDDMPPESLPEYRKTDRLHHIVETLMLAQGYSGGPWVLKSPKLMFLWKYFEEIYPKSKWVIVRRNLDVVAESLERTPAITIPMRNHDLSLKNIRRIVGLYEDRLNSIKSQLPPGRCREINSEDVVNGDWDRLEDIVEWAGLNFDREAFEDFVEPSYFQKSAG